MKKKPPRGSSKCASSTSSELAREREVRGAPAALEQLEQPVREKRIVVEISGEARAPVLVRGLEPAAAPELRANEVDRARRGCRELGLAEPARGRARARAIISPFHDTSTFSSRPGHTRRSRAASSFARAFEQRCAASRGSEAERRGRLIRRRRDVQVPRLRLEVRLAARAVARSPNTRFARRLSSASSSASNSAGVQT